MAQIAGPGLLFKFTGGLATFELLLLNNFGFFLKDSFRVMTVIAKPINSTYKGRGIFTVDKIINLCTIMRLLQA